MPDRDQFLKSEAAAAPYLPGYAARATPPKANSAMRLTTGMPGVWQWSVEQAVALQRHLQTVRCRIHREL